MEPVDNNQFEVVPTQKRKVPVPCSNVYLNPALDLLANEDPMCNTAMEIVPIKKRKRSKSCDIIAFENSALDLGISKAAVNEFLAKELENVKKNVRYCVSEPSTSLHRNFDDTIQSNTDTLETKIEIVKPNLSGKLLSESNINELSCNLTVNNSEQVFEIPNIDSELKTAIAEPMYANLTDVELEMQGPCTTNVFQAQTAHIDANNVEINKQDMSTLPKEQDNDINTTMQDCMDISKIDNVTDSGISVFEQKSSTTANLENNDLSTINKTNIQTSITNQIFVNNTSNLSLSFIDRLALDSPNLSNQSFILDDDLNESNIMEIKTITIITKKKRIPDKKRNTNPFLDPTLTKNFEQSVNTIADNPFFSTNEITNELEYNEEMVNRPEQTAVAPPTAVTLMPRRLFTSDVNSTISTVNESVNQNDQHEYENIDNYRSDSPIYENVSEMYDGPFNKQSKVLGCDVSRFSAIDIMNLNKNSQGNSSNESNESKKDSKHKFFKTLRPKKMLKTLKKTFKGEKHASNQSCDHNVTINPYEVPRKLPKDRSVPKDTSGIENPALNLDTSDIEIEELEDFDDDEEHQYETIKTLRNTRLNMNVTPLKERNIDNIDISHNKTNTPGKKVRFDSTLNQEKIITGNSFDYDLQSPGFDSKIDKYHDELENCINERKFLQQNM